MKRLFCLILLVVTLSMAALAFAESERSGVTDIGETPVAIDLDGDGSPESVSCAMVPDDFDVHLKLRVVSEAGVETAYDSGFVWNQQVCAVDLDGDGTVELFASGDVMSDDYYTVCLQYTGDCLREVLFADVRRGENTPGAYFKYGYGGLEGMNPDAATVTLSGSQDVLGTWFGSRTLKLTEGGLFEYADDGWWLRDTSNFGEDIWDSYAALNPLAEIAYTSGSETGVLRPGDRFLITGSDKQKKATFLAEDGRTGTLAIAVDYDRGWGWTINDVPEEELFEIVPYAD